MKKNNNNELELVKYTYSENRYLTISIKTKKVKKLNDEYINLTKNMMTILDKVFDVINLDIIDPIIDLCKEAKIYYKEKGFIYSVCLKDIEEIDIIYNGLYKLLVKGKYIYP